MHPALALWLAAMALVVVPVILWGRSGIAAIIGAAWLGGEIAHFTGIPLLPTQFICHVFALVFVLGHASKPTGFLAGAIFIPRAFNDAFNLGGMIDPWLSWWADYWLAWAQLIFLLASIEWPMFKGNLERGFSGIGLPRLDLMVGHRG